MKLSSNIRISLFKEVMNVLKAWFSVVTGKMYSRPVSINLLPSMACNSRCIMCDSWKIQPKEEKIGMEVYEKLSDEIKEMGIPYVTIGGGEPLLFKNLYPLIRLFRDKGISVQLTTNGKELNLEKCKKLIDCGLNRLTFSIDSHIKQVYGELRGVDWFDEVIKNLSDCIKTYADQISIETNSVITVKNIDTFPETVNYFLALGVNKICFSAVTVSGENYLIGQSKDDLAKANPQSVKKLVKELLFLKRGFPHRKAIP